MCIYIYLLSLYQERKRKKNSYSALTELRAGGCEFLEISSFCSHHHLLLREKLAPALLVVLYGNMFSKEDGFFLQLQLAKEATDKSKLEC